MVLARSRSFLVPFLHKSNPHRNHKLLLNRDPGVICFRQIFFDGGQMCRCFNQIIEKGYSPTFDQIMDFFFQDKAVLNADDMGSI